MKPKKSYTCLVQITYPGPTGHSSNLTRVATIQDFPFHHLDNDDDDDNWEGELMYHLALQLKALEFKNLYRCAANDFSNNPKWEQQIKELKKTNYIPNFYRIRFKATRVSVTVIEHVIDPIDHTIESEVLLEEWNNYTKK